MTYTCFALERRGHVAHARLCRPEKRNSMIPAFWRELPALVEALEAEGGVRAMVLSSEGPHFCSGLDLAMFAGLASADGSPAARHRWPLEFLDLVKTMQDALSSLEQARFPVLAAIQGACIGGAVDLVTACDIRYASADAYFSVYETNIGMTADIGTFPRLVKLVPEGMVRELAYTGRRFDAEEARGMGLVNRVYEDHAAMVEGVLTLADEIARKAPIAVHGCKRVITHARDHGTAEGLEHIALWNASMLHIDQIMEAIGAAGEQREGRFTDLPARRAPFGED